MRSSEFEPHRNQLKVDELDLEELILSGFESDFEPRWTNLVAPDGSANHTWRISPPLESVKDTNAYDVSFDGREDQPSVALNVIELMAFCQRS